MARPTQIALAALAGFIAIQLVPYGRDHENPAVVAEPEWNAPETRALFMRACGDCHSNETVWPAYANVAPVSWLMQHDVDEARSHFNVSRWGQGKQDADEAAEMLREGEMPPILYLLAHPEADLEGEERAALLAGLIATFGEETHGGDHD